MPDATTGTEAQIRPEPFDSPGAQALIASVQQEYVRRYGGPDETPVTPGEFGEPHGAFFVAYDGTEPVGCGGWRRQGEDGEIKRMFVVPHARGRGLARRLLAVLEQSIAAAGLRRAILETGGKQPEAIGLYRSSGYTPIPGYGYYRCHPNSRYFGKVLIAAAEDGPPGGR